ncbi:MAG: signal peptidase II [Treponema sp.]|jgi:signal peptidase II|nr:signal peptidase II [Treponema sp.]
MAIADRKKQIFVTLAVFLANILADRLTKLLAVEFLKGKRPAAYLNNLVVFYYAENDGAFLSLGAGWNSYFKYLVFIIVPLGFCAAILVYLMVKEKETIRVVLLSCVAGGGTGNLIDRLCNEFRVVDFLNFGVGGLRTGILNTADLSVTFGAAALVILELAGGRARQKPDGSGGGEKQ